MFWAALVQAVGSIVSVIVSFVAIIISVSSRRIAESSLHTAEDSAAQAKRVADRALQDWRQTKWFDLYFKTNNVYDWLDRFQNTYGSATGPNYGSLECDSDWNGLIAAVRVLHVAALVYPRSDAVDKLISATEHFEVRERDAFDKTRLPKLMEALQGLRDKALVSPDILG
jgi:hypothetical protein